MATTTETMYRATASAASGASNLLFDEIKTGQSASVPHTLSKPDVELLAFLSGRVDALQLIDGEKVQDGDSADAVAGAALLSALLQRQLPGPGTVVLEQALSFHGAFAVGDQIVGTVTAGEKHAADRSVVFHCTVKRGEDIVVEGTVTVAVPDERITYRPDAAPPKLILRRTDGIAKLLSACDGFDPVTCAVVHPCDRDSLLGALEAARHALIDPVLVGPEAKIRAVAETEGVDLSPYRLIATEHSHEAAQVAAGLARDGKVAALMKGSLHTDELMGALVPRAAGLRTDRRISHVFLLDVPSYPRPLMVTDAAINVAPDIRDKADIVQNAIELAHVIGIERPRVAALAAVETVNPDMQATIDAAMLCKMADRGQITGGLVDGPLAFDNAINEEAAKTKGIHSEVAGRADILLAPDLEAGNMIAKQLQYLAGADSAGIVLGMRIPVVLTSRADDVRTRLASTALLALVAESRRRRASA
jgi:phosphate acetyltransferase